MPWVSFNHLLNQIHMKHHNVTLSEERAFKSFMLESHIRNNFIYLPFGALTKDSIETMRSIFRTFIID